MFHSFISFENWKETRVQDSIDSEKSLKNVFNVAVEVCRERIALIYRKDTLVIDLFFCPKKHIFAVFPTGAADKFLILFPSIFVACRETFSWNLVQFRS